jgi:hypothetical protein
MCPELSLLFCRQLARARRASEIRPCRCCFGGHSRRHWRIARLRPRFINDNDGLIAIGQRAAQLRLMVDVHFKAFFSLAC